MAHSGQFEDENLKRIAGFNRTTMPFPDRATLPALLETQFIRHAAKTAVTCDHDRAFGAETFTYGQLNERVNQLAHRLRAEGVRPGQVIALLVERSFAMIIGILGVVKAGAAYLPIAPDTPPERLAYLLRDGGVNVLLVQNRTARRIEFGGLMINLENPEIYHGSAGPPANLNTPQDLAYVIYTSGSTGKPKGVMIEQRSLINRLHWMQQAYPIDDGDVILQKTPYTFDVSVWELFWWAMQGARLCFLMPGGERNPLAIAETVRKHKVTVLHFVPSMLNVFLDYFGDKPDAVKRNLPSVRRVFASGEALTPGQVRKFNALWGVRTGARLTNLYGPTEATVDVTHFDCSPGHDFEIVPIGRPIHNIRIHILQDGRPVALGEPGELCIAGVGLARGYLNNAALTAEKFTGTPALPGERIYRTGDLARWLPDGNIEYLGREDDQVKIRGLRIELGEIENTIREYPGIRDCVAVVRKHSESIILIVAYLVCNAELVIDELRQHLKRQLPDYMIPNLFERIAELPLTPSGKADRKALPEPGVQPQIS